MILAILASILPGFFWLWYFNRYDRQEAEPFWQLGKAVLFGALAVLPAIIWEAPFRGQLQKPGTVASQLLLSFFVVGLAEELFKFLAVYLVVARSPEFNEPLDGIIYSVAAAVGFSTVENILYIATFGLLIAPFRATIASLAHIAFSGLAGYYLGKARFSSSPKANFFLGLGIAVFLHGLYDFLLIARLASPLLITLFVLGAQYLLLLAIKSAKGESVLGNSWH